MKSELKKTAERFGVEDYSSHRIPAHEGGRNQIHVLQKDGMKPFILRISSLDDRAMEDYLAETEFVRYLAANGASVADVIPSVNGNLVEQVEIGGRSAYVSLFEYAPGMLISDNGYRYRAGAPLSEYFYNTGKTLGRIHNLSKEFHPVHRRAEYDEKYNMTYIDRLIPDSYAELKRAIAARVDAFRSLPRDRETYGLVHFDFSDGNYHIRMDTGDITVFDFDNSIYCWYMFDLANLWTHGVGWCRSERDPEKRRAFMADYFDTVLAGYRTETTLPEELAGRLPLFIDMVLIENIVDEFECAARAEGSVDAEDIEEAAESLIHQIPYAGFLQ